MMPARHDHELLATKLSGRTGVLELVSILGGALVRALARETAVGASRADGQLVGASAPS
jgi:hypothetical protein